MKSYTALFLLFLFSCNKSDKGAQDDIGRTTPRTLTGASTFNDFFYFMHQPSDGIFGIQSSVTMAGQSGTRTCLVGGSFHDTSWNGLAGGPVSIGGITMHDSSFSSRYTYGLSQPQSTTMYGSTATFSINPNTGGGTTGANATASLYVPQLISLSSPGLNDSIKVASSGSTVFSWTADASDTSSVIIAFQYDPTNPRNSSLASSYPNLISTGKTVSDGGSYTFLSSDTVGLPPNSWIDVRLVRPNYASVYSTDSTKKYLIYAYSSVLNTFFYKR